MDLKTYLRSLPAAEKRRFAERCGVTLQHLKFVAYRAKNPSAELAIAIERESGGEVVAEQICPHLTWYVLRARPRSCRCEPTAAGGVRRRGSEITEDSG